MTWPHGFHVRRWKFKPGYSTAGHSLKIQACLIRILRLYSPVLTPDSGYPGLIIAKLIKKRASGGEMMSRIELCQTGNNDITEVAMCADGGNH